MSERALRLHTEVVEARGSHRLSQLLLRDRRTGQEKVVPAATLLVMTARPRSPTGCPTQ